MDSFKLVASEQVPYMFHMIFTQKGKALGHSDNHTNNLLEVRSSSITCKLQGTSGSSLHGGGLGGEGRSENSKLKSSRPSLILHKN